MARTRLATILNYCTNDYQFLRFNINQISQFSSQIIIPYCDHFFDGSKENFKLINRSIKANPQAQFIPFKYNPQATRNLWRGWQFLLEHLHLGTVWGPQYWICSARQLGFKQVKKNIDYVLFLDADEIIDGQRFLHWLNTFNYQKYPAIKLANYWYFRSPRYQALTWEDTPLLARRTTLESAVFMARGERQATFNSILKPKKRMVLGIDKKPMIHHYGWAKPKKNLLKKVSTWGHTKDRNWTKLIENEFSQPFSGTDFLYHRQYKQVKPYIKF